LKFILYRLSPDPFLELGVLSLHYIVPELGLFRIVGTEGWGIFKLEAGVPYGDVGRGYGLGCSNRALTTHEG
jgi:hypothetical protein